eukprot:6636195-Prymnesium_polylepis.1
MPIMPGIAYAESGSGSTCLRAIEIKKTGSAAACCSLKARLKTDATRAYARPFPASLLRRRF